MKKIALKSVIFLFAIIALFSCASESIVLKTVPQLTTTTITNITLTTASSGGNITSDGGEAVTARGIVWNTTTAPTINLSTKTNDGAGIGIFSSTITNLIPSSTYFVRAYATNSVGTAYGSEVNFNTPNCNAGSTITDIDGNIYNTIVIGNQVWMKENLNTSKYSNGDPITNLTSRNDWQYSSAGGSSYYGFVVNNLEGKLYNGFAVQDPRGLCPCGYHVPSKNEWIIFQNYLTALGASSGVNPAKAIASKINWVLSTVANTVGITQT